MRAAKPAQAAQRPLFEKVRSGQSASLVRLAGCVANTNKSGLNMMFYYKCMVAMTL